MSASDSDTPVGSFAAARAKAAAQFDSSKAGRKKRNKRTAKSVNPRSLNGSGRLSQFNFRSTEELKATCHQLAEEDGLSLCEWMEIALEDHIARRRGTASE